MNSISEFWRMVIEQDVDVIIMVANFEEGVSILIFIYMVIVSIFKTQYCNYTGKNWAILQ